VQHCTETPQRVLDSLLIEIAEFTEGAASQDDKTILIGKIGATQ
jgi:hypothetical protein